MTASVPPTRRGARGSAPAVPERRHLFASRLSAAFHPILTGAYVLVVVGVVSAPSPPAGLVWSLSIIVVASGIPGLDLLIRVRTGRVSSIDVALREQRRRPLLVALTCCLLSLGLLVGLGGPRPLVVALVAALISGAVLAAVTTSWKISFHTAVLAGGMVIIGWIVGPAVLGAVPLLAAVGWSRVALGRHTVAQVIAGTVVGAAVCGGVVVLA